MKAYIYQAELYCEACGEDIKANIAPPDGHDPDNEHAWDSDDYPKGPYSDGGGEADFPQHCGRCGVHLENPLTKDGRRYVLEQILGVAGDGDDATDTLREWWHYYREDIIQAIGEIHRNRDLKGKHHGSKNNRR